MIVLRTGTFEPTFLIITMKHIVINVDKNVPTHHDTEKSVLRSITTPPFICYAPTRITCEIPSIGFFVTMTFAINEKIIHTSHMRKMFLSPTPANLSIINTPFTITI